MVGPGERVKHCLGSVGLLCLCLSPCPLPSSECPQYQNSALLPKILSLVETLLRSPDQGHSRGQGLQGFTHYYRIHRKETLACYLLFKVCPSHPEMYAFDNG